MLIAARFNWITLFTLLNAAVMYVLMLFAMVVGISRWQQLKATFRRGTLPVITAVLLGLPFDLVIGWHTDMSRLTGLHIPTDMVATLRYVGVVSALVGVVFGFAFRVFQVPAAVHLARAGHEPFPGLLQGTPRWRSLGLGALIGGIGAAVSVPLFAWLRVGYGEVFKQLQELYHLDLDEPSLLWGALFPMALGAAISEELIYRGILQQGLSKLFKQSRAGVVIAVCVSSLVWALAHIGSADNNLLKVVQIFLLGLAFGWLCRKHSLEASIVAHLSMNFFSVVVGALIG
ncbi:MAG: CPBP family intramembrane glutamic endopeptidase [Polyangiaceae bacterium]